MTKIIVFSDIVIIIDKILISSIIRWIYINDINYMSSCYGLQKWADPFYWHMYKYAVAVPVIEAVGKQMIKALKISK